MRLFSGTGRIVTLDHADFEIACADLMKVVRAHAEPRLLIGVRTGGLHVAEAMVRATGNNVPILPITCRRPTTRYKRLTAPARKLIAGLPRAVLDRLRFIEHAMLTRKREVDRPVRSIDPDELAAFDWWAARTGPAPTVIIVDDSVDTGTTLARVTEVIRTRMPRDGTLLTAAVTVTTRHPVLMPDYVLLRQQLCRFPWSLDAGTQRTC